MDVKPEINILWIAEWNVQGFHCFHLLIFNLWDVLSFKDRTSCWVWWKLIHSRYMQWVISRVLFFVVGVFSCLLWKGEGGLQHHSYQLFPELSLEFSEAPSRSPCSPPSIGCSGGTLSERTLLNYLLLYNSTFTSHPAPFTPHPAPFTVCPTYPV